MKTNQELLDEANSIDFKIKSNGALNARLYGRHERGLFFIKNALAVHGMDKYKYGLVLDAYTDNKAKVPVICRDHGEFLTIPGLHVSSGTACPKCGGVHKPSTEEWIAMAREVHGDRYDYSKVIYKTNRDKVTIGCVIHGFFEQDAGAHTRGKGCNSCGNTVISHKLRSTLEEFICKAREVHGERYRYDKAKYVSAKTKLDIICPQHGTFSQTPNNHLNGQGCPFCGARSSNIVYLLRCVDTGLYKIGIATESPRARMQHIGGNLEEIYYVMCENPREHETYLHKQYKDFNVYHEGVRNGNTEFFSLNEEQVATVRQYMSSIANN